MADTNAHVTNRNNIQNPWSRENRSEYKMGTIEKFMHDTLGFRTGYDQYHEQMDNEANAWETQNQSLEYEEQYNSAEAQAERLRNAGINPDLNHSQINPGEASEMTEPEVRVQSPIGQDMEALQTAGEAGAKLGMNLLGILSGGTDILAKIGEKTQDIDIKNLGVGEEMLNLIPELHSYFEEVAEEDKDFGNELIAGSKRVYNLGVDWARKMGLNQRNSKRLMNLYNFMQNSIPSALKNKEKILESDTLDYQTWLTKRTQRVQEILTENQIKRAEIDAKYNQAEQELYEEFPNLPKEIIKAERQYSEADAKAGISEASARTAQAKYRKLEATKKEEIAKTDLEFIQQYDSEFVSGRINSHYRSDTKRYQGAMGRQYGGTRGIKIGAFGFSYGEND